MGVRAYKEFHYCCTRHFSYLSVQTLTPPIPIDRKTQNKHISIRWHDTRYTEFRLPSSCPNLMLPASSSAYTRHPTSLLESLKCARDTDQGAARSTLRHNKGTGIALSQSNHTTPPPWRLPPPRCVDWPRRYKDRLHAKKPHPPPSR